MRKEKVTWIHHWSDRTFSFRTTRDQNFRFSAGEFVLIGLKIENKPVLRAYSIVSPPWAEYLEFLSIKMPDGELTSKLQHIKIDDEVVIMDKTTGTLRNEAIKDGKTLWLLSTGTGLAPWPSIIRDLDSLERWNDIRVVHSVRNRDDLAYYKDLSTAYADSEPDLAETLKEKLTYIPIVTGEGDKRITEQLGKALPIDPINDKVMICGNLQFNYDVADWCKEQGMQEGSLRDPGDFVLERAFVEK
jgi:ferredoxin--NADP+ reductase